MKKQLTCIFLAVLLCVMAVSPAFAGAPRVVDDADLLTVSEEAELTAKLNEISERQQMDVVVVTVNSLEGKTPQAFADDYYEYHDYGFGAEKDGILLLISMEANDWYITTDGSGIAAFTDAGIAYISEQFLFWLSDGFYVEAFQEYADQCDDFITQAKTGAPYDVDNLPHEPLSFFAVIVSLVIGLIIALISVAVMKGQLKTVYSEPAADSYVAEGSMNVTGSREFFLYRNVTRREKPKDENKKAGGSTTHRSSSGRTHGGGGGKFQRINNISDNISDSVNMQSRSFMP